MKVTELRKNIYRVLDTIIETGEPVEIERNGQILKIDITESTDKLMKIKKRKNIIVGNSDDLPEITWDKEWKNEFI